MKRIDVELSVIEGGTIQIKHLGTKEFTTFKNTNLLSFLVNQEKKILDKLVNVKDNDDESS